MDSVELGISSILGAIIALFAALGARDKHPNIAIGLVVFAAVGGLQGVALLLRHRRWQREWREERARMENQSEEKK